jgi:hypothetical protein
MTTYEEDIADIYYNLQDYFTIMNIPFPPKEKREGGRGRGEIDLLAIKIKDNKVIDAIHVEVGVSLTSAFPFISKTRPKIDECNRIISKFFSNDSEYKIRELIGDTPFRRVMITSYFAKNCLEKLRERIPDFGGKIIEVSKDGEDKINLKIDYNNKILNLELITFPRILNDTKILFKKKGLENKNFQDTRYRAIHYMIEGSN